MVGKGASNRQIVVVENKMQANFTNLFVPSSILMDGRANFYEGFECPFIRFYSNFPTFQKIIVLLSSYLFFAPTHLPHVCIVLLSFVRENGQISSSC